jgi:hypothetical protein
VVDIDGAFLRVQCKTGRLRNGCVIFRAQSIRSNTREAMIRDYKEDVDLFAIHCPDTDGIYVVPIEDATRTQGTLRIEPTSNGQDEAFGGLVITNCPPSSTGRARSL